MSFRIVLLVALGLGLSDAAFTKTTSCVCGIKGTNTRIVGGQEAGINEYPWIASIWYGTQQHFCGGSLINNQYILTAAHCTVGMDASQIIVRLGEHDFTSTTETSNTITRSVSKIINHAGYDELTMEHDIALLKLSSPVTMDVDEGVLPVCLPPDNKSQYLNFIASVYGWGTLSSGGDSPDKLQEVVVPMVTNDECDSAYGIITDNQICAGAEGKDSCQGDSGGPLTIVDGGNRVDQIGVVSFGAGCGDKGYPGVYTRVSKYRDWIDENTSDATYCSGFV